MLLNTYITPLNRIHEAFFILFILGSLNIYAQNRTEKRIASHDISTIVINGDQIFSIDIQTKATSTITIHTISEGELKNETVMVSELKDGKLYVSLSENPFVKNANDKLSAHKVIAVKLSMVLPEGLSIELLSDIASVKLRGKYANIDMQLSTGNSIVNAMAKHAKVLTINGNIEVKTTNATVKAMSKHGKVTNPVNDSGHSHWELQSIHGDINVVKND